MKKLIIMIFFFVLFNILNSQNRIIEISTHNRTWQALQTNGLWGPTINSNYSPGFCGGLLDCNTGVGLPGTNQTNGIWGNNLGTRNIVATCGSYLAKIVRLRLIDTLNLTPCETIDSVVVNVISDDLLDTIYINNQIAYQRPNSMPCVFPRDFTIINPANFFNSNSLTVEAVCGSEASTPYGFTMRMRIFVSNGLYITGNTELCDTTANALGVNLTASAPCGGQGVTYLWSTGASTPSINVKTPGIYNVTATINGIIKTSQVSVTYEKFENKIDKTCSNTFITLSSNNIKNGNNYLWSNGSTSPTINVSSAGWYYLTVTNSNGCTTIDSINANCCDSNLLVISGNTELCDTSSNSSGVNLSASGINGTYLWSTGATTQTINVKTPGVYSVSVTVNGCVLTKQITVRYTNFENNINRNCSRGLVLLSSNNRNNGNSYSWSNGSTSSSISVNSGGWYYLTVTNSNGCTTIDSIEANCCDSNLFVDIIGDSIICNNEDITLEAQNNFNNPQYQWSHNLGSNSTAVVNSPGTYYVTVCESSGEEQNTMCCKVDSFKVSYNNFIEIIGDSIFCSSIGLNPDLNIHTTNNLSQITWTFPDGSQSNSNTITANQAGIYLVNVTDENGCISSDTFNVVENCCAGFQASIRFSKDTICYQNDSVVISALPNNAASYQWNTGQSTQSFSLSGTGIRSHIYTVTVTDNNGCIDTVSDTMFMKDCFPPCGGVVILSSRISSNKTTICNNGRESAVLTVSPAGLNRVWSTGATLSSISVNTPGTYWVITTDSLGCNDSSSFVLLGKVCDTVNCDSINFGISSSSDSICTTKKENVLITAYPSNAIYNWSPISSTNQSISINSAGTYMVTITFNGCVKILKKVISSSECKSCTDTCDWHLNGNDYVQSYNFIGSKNNADFKIRTNNIERAIVKADGKIGVGTSTPTEQLHTTQGVRFEGLSKLDSPKRIVVQDNTGKLYWSDALSFKGSKGDKGDQGIQGVKGDKGDKGDTGSQGVKGDKGDQGVKGDKGDQGIQGLKGDKGDKGDQGIAGLQGPIGLTGPQGPVGPSPVITNTLTLVGNTLTSTVSGISSNTITLPSATGNFWSLGGNPIVTSTNNIIGITNANSNPLRFFTNNSEKMTITSNGNVGIGTPAPSARLYVNGDINGLNTDFITTGRAQIIGSNPGMWITHNTQGNRSFIGMEPGITNHSFGVWNSNLSAWHINMLNNGNVGIGTTSPLNNLHVNGGARITSLPANTASDRLVFANSSGDLRSLAAGNTSQFLRGDGTWQTLPSATGNFWSLGGNPIVTSTNNIIGITNANSNPLRFFTNNSEKMTILSNGNIGVGTTNPSNSQGWGRVLDVFNSNHSKIISSNSLVKTGLYSHDNLGGWGGLNGAWGLIGTETNHGVAFISNYSPRMVILNTGNIGIGTVTPSNKLEITHGTANNSGLRFTNLTNSSSSLVNSTNKVLSVNASGDVILVDDKQGTGNTTNSCNVNGSIPRLNGTNSYTCSQVFDNGTSVGVGAISGFTYSSYSGATIGSNVPLSSGNVKLEVNGVLRSTMSIVTSDGKLKTDVKDLKEALSIVKSLKGKTYNWSSEFQKKSGVDNGRHIGFIAQEIREVLPELVIEDENKQLGVNYTELIPVLVEAIKDQQNQIDALKSGNKVSSIAPSLNVDIDAMNKEMNQLKSENQMFKEKFELLEKSISLLCESGCAGLEKAKQNAEDADVLYQSIPNPTDNEALINFYLSKKYNNASIQIKSLEGKSMETIVLDASQGKGSVKIQLGQYAAQTYFYSLIVDNKVVDTKKLTVIR